MQPLRRILIFSKDRAMQLLALLESLKLQCLDFEESVVTILYKTTAPQHQNQYVEIQKMFPSINFRRDKELSTDFLNVVINSQYIMFLVDDSIFVREFRFSDVITALDKNLDCVGFSLRLGKNISYSYPHNQNQDKISFSELDNEMLKFDWTQYTYDFGYPMEISSSIYCSYDILELAMGVKFSSVNNIESVLDAKKTLLKKDKPMLMCFSVSHAFANPINITSGLVGNRVGSNVEYSLNSLADEFDAGYKVDVSSFKDFTPIGCHQEVSLPWIER